MLRTSRSTRAGRMAALLLLGLSAGCQSVSTPVAPTSVPSVARATAAPTPIVTPDPTVAAFVTWTSVASIQWDTPIAGFVASDEGYLIVAARNAWFSADGSTWTQAALPFDPYQRPDVGGPTHAWANDAAADADGFAVVGEYEHKPCVAPNFTAGGPPECAVSPIAWFSVDGRTWTSSISAPLPLHDLQIPDYRAFGEVWAAGDGWDASAETRESVDVRAKELLHTADGIHWSALAAPPGRLGDHSLRARDGLGTASGDLIVWQLWDRITEHLSTTLAMTPAGQGWMSLDAFPGDLAIVETGIAPAAGVNGPWILGGETNNPTIWTSNDLETWNVAKLTAPGAAMRGSVVSIARWADRYIAIVVQAPGDGTLVESMWTSIDGLDWDFDGQSPGQTSALKVAVGPSGLLGLRQTDASIEIFGAR